tara:strand:+ start:87937 stop:88380 length:444 start_codon:yes stop_codon:yes gene_type:complete
MSKSEFLEAIEQIFKSFEEQIPKYMMHPEDSSIAEGNVAVCIIDEDGQVYGKMYGKDKVKQRHFYKIAWTKASQVWITGKKTGEFEELVFAGKLDDNQFGIERPDFIGWEGGQPIKLGDKILAVGFSGFRGVNDLEIVVNAVNEVKI